MSLPVTILNSPAVSDPVYGGSNPAFGTSRDIAGIVVWAVGFLIESIADAQKVNLPHLDVSNKGSSSDVNDSIEPSLPGQYQRVIL